MLAIGMSANTISMLALVVAIGVVVDDAIVVVENVERVMEEYPELSPQDATKMAMRQITGPIIAISLVLLSVFVPVAFIPGLSGELFKQFAITISVTMLISATNALTLSPALCALFLRPVTNKATRKGPFSRLSRGIDRVRNGYGYTVGRLVRFAILVIPIIGVCLFCLIFLAGRTPGGFPAGGGPGPLSSPPWSCRTALPSIGRRRWWIASPRCSRPNPRWPTRSRSWAIPFSMVRRSLMPPSWWLALNPSRIDPAKPTASRL